MAVPALRIPISVPMQDLQRDMEKGISITKQATRQIGQAFVSANKEILASGVSMAALLTREYVGMQARSAATALAMRVAWVAAAAVIVQSVIGIIGATREQLQELLALADKANKADVRPEFFQAFTAGARNMKVELKDLEDALHNAFQNTKDTLNPDWKVWDEGLRKVTAVEKALTEMRELFTTDQKFTGLDLFRNAGNTEDRTRAVLTAMIELQAIGQDLAALDLGEKMFGGKFADNIRQGNTSAQELLATVDKLSGGGPGIWSKDLVEETKEIDRLLKSANEELSRNLKPQWEGLVGLANEIKSVWASIIGILSRGVEIVNELDPIRWADRLRSWSRGETQDAFEKRMREFKASQDLAGQAGINDIGTPPNPLGISAGVRDVSPAAEDRSGNVPLPRRRPSDAPKPEVEKETKDEVDAFDRATEAIGRHIAALHADAAAVGLGKSAHEQLRVELRLLEAARQSGVEITDDQITAYAKLRTEMGAEQALAQSGIKLDEEQAASFIRLSASVRAVSESLEAKKRAFSGVNDAIRFGGNELINVIDQATQKGAKFGDIMSDVFRSIGREALRAAITGEGAFAKLFGLASDKGGVGGIGGLIASFFGGGAGGVNPVVPGATNVVGIAGNVPVPTFLAGGGDIPDGGQAYVGEHGPNPMLLENRTSKPIMVTPNNITQLAGTSGGAFAPHFNFGDINAPGAGPGVGEEIYTMLRSRFIPEAVAAVRQSILQRKF